mmetsp:Transcript_68985/g.197887  ORF Transcript_68985/g.197887 Transcript_68985/m.197887 type:complete len:239 (-) Transcript_68985:780-1496(-)
MVVLSALAASSCLREFQMSSTSFIMACRSSVTAHAPMRSFTSLHFSMCSLMTPSSSLRWPASASRWWSCFSSVCARASLCSSIQEPMLVLTCSSSTIWACSCEECASTASEKLTCEHFSLKLPLMVSRWPLTVSMWLESSSHRDRKPEADSSTILCTSGILAWYSSPRRAVIDSTAVVCLHRSIARRSRFSAMRPRAVASHRSPVLLLFSAQACSRQTSKKPLQDATVLRSLCAEARS